MYLPKNKYKVFFTNGEELVRQDGSSYTGYYIKTSSGRILEGSSLDSIGEDLILLNNNNTLSELDFPYNYYNEPTENDYANGYYIRFILRDKNSGWFKEVNKEKFEEFINLPYIDGIELKWFLNSPANDTKINGFEITGSATKNSNLLNSLENKYPNISLFLNPTEFIR